MAPIFCPDCGNILDRVVEETVICDCCGKVCQNTARSETTITTTRNFPSVLRHKLTSKIQEPTRDDYENTQRIAKECPECKAKEMSWTQAQLRGADEGSTIFYRCSCGYRGKEDN